MINAQSLDDCLAWLEQLHPIAEIELGLARVASVARVMNLLDFDATVVTIAGTNGKGSATAMVEAAALACDQRVGCYTSPHIFHFNERIRINGESAPDDAIARALKAVEQARAEIHLTYFEYTTLAALTLFKQANLDLIVLEVGLGGRLDAVNIIDADIAVITSIGLDHQAWLGDTREAICQEKMGILRADQKVIITELDPPKNMRAIADSISANVAWLGQDIRYRGCGEELELGLADGALLVVPQPEQLSVESYITALQIAQYLSLSLSPAALQRLARVGLAGRFQRLVSPGGGTVVLDVAHNPAAMQRLVDKLQRTHPTAAWTVCYATMEDKDVDVCLACLQQLNVEAWVLPSLDVPRAMPPNTLHKKFNTSESCASVTQASVEQSIASLGENQYLLICGSFYTVAAGLATRSKRIG